MKKASTLFERLVEDNKDILDSIEKKQKNIITIPFIKLSILLAVGCSSVFILMVSKNKSLYVIGTVSLFLLVIYFILGRWNLNKKNKSSYEELAAQLQRNVSVLLNKEDIGIDGIKLLKEEAQYYKKSTSNLVKEQFEFLTRFLSLLFPGALLYKGIIIFVDKGPTFLSVLGIVLGIVLFILYYNYDQKEYLETSKYQLLYDILFNIEINKALKNH